MNDRTERPRPSLDELAEGLPPEDIANVLAAIAALKAGDRAGFERIASEYDRRVQGAGRG